MSVELTGMREYGRVCPWDSLTHSVRWNRGGRSHSRRSLLLVLRFLQKFFSFSNGNTAVVLLLRLLLRLFCPSTIPQNRSPPSLLSLSLSSSSSFPPPSSSSSSFSSFTPLKIGKLPILHCFTIFSGHTSLHRRQCAWPKISCCGS